MFLCLMLPIWVLCRSLFWFVRAALLRFLWTNREFQIEKFVTIAKFLITYTTGLSVINFLYLFCGELVVNVHALLSTRECSCFVVNSWIFMFCGQLVNFHVLWSTRECSCFVVNSWIFMVPVIAFMCLSLIFLSNSLTSCSCIWYTSNLLPDSCICLINCESLATSSARLTRPSAGRFNEAPIPSGIPFPWLAVWKFQ